MRGMDAQIEAWIGGQTETWRDGWNRVTSNSGETRKRGGDIDDLSRIEHAMGSPWSAPSPSESKSLVAAWYIMPSHSTCTPQMWMHQIQLTQRQRCLCCSAASQPDNTGSPPCQTRDGGRLTGEPAHLLCCRQSGGQQAPCFAHHAPCPQSASSGHCRLPPPFCSPRAHNRLGSLYEKKTVV